MKHVIAFLLFALVLGSCSKISLDRLEGTWEVVEMEEIPTDIFDTWKHWLDTTEVKVAFFADGTQKSFYFENSVLVGFSGGTYTLMEDDEKLVVNDTSLVFNSHGLPLDIAELRRNKMILEGRYYLHAIDSTIPMDSFRMVRWTLEQ